MRRFDTPSAQHDSFTNTSKTIVAENYGACFFFFFFFFDGLKMHRFPYQCLLVCIAKINTLIHGLVSPNQSVRVKYKNKEPVNDTKARDNSGH